MIYIVGAGSGAVDLITVRGARLLERATCIVYAGSLVNPDLLSYAPADCVIHDSASMTLEEVIEVLEAESQKPDACVVRLHTGDPSLYGAIREQIEILHRDGFETTVVPGVSSAFGAAASLQAEFTVPEITQTLIISRIEGRTPVPSAEAPEKLAQIGGSMAFFLSVGKVQELCDRLISGGKEPTTPAAAIYKATWDDEAVVHGTLETLPALIEEAGFTATTMIFVGEFLDRERSTGRKTRSKLYDPDFSHLFRRAKQ